MHSNFSYNVMCCTIIDISLHVRQVFFKVISCFPDVNKSLFIASAMSWSYQSNSPCSVLVKEKQDGQGRDCPPSILHSSSTETVASSQDQPEISSSLGNSVGGKKRSKRNSAHADNGINVVFDGVGHENEKNKPHEAVEKRVLVNISIVLDGGSLSKSQDIYQLQVAVPLPSEKPENFFRYKVDEGDDNFLNLSSTFNAQETTPFDTSSTIETTERTSTESDDFTKGLKTNLNEKKGKLMEND
jgi:hypothetical protein